MEMQSLSCGTQNDGAEERSRFRETLRERLLRSPLMDAKGFTSALEARYREMWRAWCDGPMDQ